MLEAVRPVSARKGDLPSRLGNMAFLKAAPLGVEALQLLLQPCGQVPGHGQGWCYHEAN